MYKELVSQFTEENEWTNIQPPCPDNEIVVAEKTLGYSFPKELRNLLTEMLETNGSFGPHRKSPKNRKGLGKIFTSSLKKISAWKLTKTGLSDSFSLEGMDAVTIIVTERRKTV